MANNEEKDTDILLLKRFNRRDPRAFTLAYTRFFTELHVYASRLYRNAQTLPEDAVQDVFCYLWESRDKSFESFAKLKAFLYVVLRNRYIHHLEHQKVADRHKEIMKREARFTEDILDSELAIQLREYVERIPDPGNRVIKYYMDGYEAKDIAEKMGMNVQTIYNIKSQAIQFLRKLFNVNHSR